MVGTWQRLAHVELSSAGDTIDSGTFTAKENLKVLIYIKPDGNTYRNITFNNDTGSNYTTRYSLNGGSDSTETSITAIAVWTDKDQPTMYTLNITNISDEEKLIIMEEVATVSGAGNAPTRSETVAKWTNTSSQITSIKVTNSDVGDFDTGSYITVLGASGDTVTDEKTTLTNVPANTRYEETDTRKIYRRKINTGSGLYWGIRTNDKSYYDLGSGNVSDSSWVLRFKWTIRDIYRGTSTDFGFLGLSDSTGGKDTSQDFVGYTYNPYNNYPYDLQLQNTDGSALGLGTGDSSGSAYSLANDTWSNGSTYYYELIRNSTTLTLKIYDNANYTGTPTTISKTIGSESGLRYLVQCGDNSRADTKTGHIGGEIGDVQFYNGQTSATTLTKTITRFDWTNAGQNSSEIYQQGQQTNSNANVSYLTYKQITGLTAGDLISAVTFDAYSYSSTAFKGGVYTDSSNQPSSLLGSGTLASDSLSNTYTTVTITLDSPVEVPSDGKVWVAVIPNTTNPNFRVTTESGGAYTHSVYATDSNPSGRSTNYANMLYSTANISGNGSNNVRFGVVINKGKWIERGKTV